MSKIEVNTIDVQCGSTLTVGSSGKTVTLATGASQSGFGRTGTVDWCTTAKTSPFTATSGDGFFVNTSGGAVTVTLPSSPSAGDIVAFKDYGNTWDVACKGLAICRNGSKINGSCNNTTLNTKAQSVTLIYVDGTKGWQDIHDSTANVSGTPAFMQATGGTVATSGDFKIHTFTSDGNFVVTQGTSAPNNNVSYMVVGGGGGSSGSTPSGNNGTGGGGGGGFREGETPQAPFTGSPLKNCAGLPVSTQTYPISVGAGGTGGAPANPAFNANGTNGSNSIFSTITSAGGGFGGNGGTGPGNGGPGGSGGGGGGGASSTIPAGNGNVPSTSPAQGNPGGTGGNTSPDVFAGGGGGATAAGQNASSGNHGDGGNGATSSITGSPVARAGGGGAGAGNPASNAGGSAGTGGGGAGSGGTPSAQDGAAGTANTGGGGGGSSSNPGAATGGAGGSGIVVIKYKFQ